jgi:uncharacterized surface protein with fasciclin (FAS1) repeats
MIRRVLLAAAVAASLALGSASAYAADIVDTAVKNGNFTILAKALGAAGLVETLKGEGPFTVFAPTDEAFNRLPKALLEDLLKPENKDKLIKILTYHVVAGEVMSADLAGKFSSPKTVEGSSVWINALGDTVWVNQATVTTADIQTDNGVIHVIDKVLIPLF